MFLRTQYMLFIGLDQPSHQSCKHTYLFKTLTCSMMAKANSLEKAMLDDEIAIYITTDILNNEADDKQSIYILWTMTLWRRCQVMEEGEVRDSGLIKDSS